MRKQLTGTESFFYILSCIVTLGGTWLSKIVIEKAIIDASKED